MPDWVRVSEHIHEVCGETLQIDSASVVGGGCINDAYMIQTDSRSLFIKVNRATRLAMFEAEFEGLRELAQSRTICVPEPLCCGVVDNDAYLVMEGIELGGAGSASQLGVDLAAMHRVTQPRYGWHRDNTIGSTHQVNDYGGDWAEFWVKNRLAFQLKLAQQKGASRLLIQRGERLCECVPAFFTDYTPEAALLHGDLWSGNYAFDRAGTPVIFDPAVYFGDRETDLAMTELFGGFPSEFYAAYNSVYPLEAGFKTRKVLYNLYHILNHFNLFGGGYITQASGMIDRLLSECR